MGANGVLIASYDQMVHAKAIHIAEQQAKRRARAQAAAQKLTAASTPESARQVPDSFGGVHVDQHMHEPRCEHASQEVPFDPLKRRTLLQWGVGVTAGSALGRIPGDQPDVHVGKLFAPGAVDETTPGLGIDPIEHFHQIKKALMDNDNIFGANSVILSVQEQIGNLQKLRQGYRGVDRKKFLQVQVQFADLCGWLYQDSGDYRAAVYWSGRALEWSHMCDDHDAIAFILARRSQLAGDMEDPAEALDAAEAALNMTPQGAVRIAAVAMTYAAHSSRNEISYPIGDNRKPLTCSDASFSGFVVPFQLHSHALRRDKANCERSYAMAQGLAGRLEADPAAPWGLFLDHSYIEVQRARSLTIFGEYRAAVQSYQKAISCLPCDYRRDRGVYLAREAVAHMGNSDVEQASAVGLRALTIGAETGSARIIGELKYLDTTLRKFSTTASAANFHDAMRGTFPRVELAGRAVEREED